MHLTPEDRLFKLRALTLLCGMGYRRSNALRGGRRTFIWGGGTSSTSWMKGRASMLACCAETAGAQPLSVERRPGRGQALRAAELMPPYLARQLPLVPWADRPPQRLVRMKARWGSLPRVSRFSFPMAARAIRR